MAEDDFSGRASRLTPREWRVVALILEGVPTHEACSGLGIAPGTYESHKQAIRRKLAIPRGERLERHLQRLAASMPAIPEQAARASAPPRPEREIADRRVRLLYRMTIEELVGVAGSAELRAQLLDQTVRRMNAEGVPEATREIQDLRKAAGEIRATAERLLAEVRAQSAPA